MKLNRSVSLLLIPMVLSVHLRAQQTGSQPFQLQHDDLIESSGLAFSHRRPWRVWTHNDSGDKARLFAFDSRGKHTGTCRLEGAASKDWEAMASFVDKGPRLLVADCGDNLEKRESIKLFLFDEPDPDQDVRLKEFQTVEVCYPDDSHNCEAVAVDPDRRIIILATKQNFSSEFFVIPLPARSAKNKTTKATAKSVGRITLPLATGMDVDLRTGDLWITSYFHAFHLPCRNREKDLKEQLIPYPKPIDLPRLKQVEAIAVDPLGSVWVSSEGSPAKMQRLKRP